MQQTNKEAPGDNLLPSPCRETLVGLGQSNGTQLKGQPSVECVHLPPSDTLMLVHHHFMITVVENFNERGGLQKIGQNEKL